MFEGVKRTLVESYIGAIALGYLFAQSVLHLANIFIVPVASWVVQNQYRDVMPRMAVSTGRLLQGALPEFLWFISILLVWYALLRWLYFKPLK